MPIFDIPGRSERATVMTHDLRGRELHLSLPYHTEDPVEIKLLLAAGAVALPSKRRPSAEIVDSTPDVKPARGGGAK